jgi:uncharacterized protein (DUF305 family)
MKLKLPRRLAVAGISMLSAVLLAALLAGCGGGGHNGGGHNGDAQPTASVPSNAAFNRADVAFATGMIPHHQQAIDMARLAATRAGSQQLKDLAGRIEKAQDPEIETMSNWLMDWGQPVPPRDAGGGHGQHAGMMTDEEMKALTAASGKDFDRMFLEMMIRHHQGAIQMSTDQQRDGQHPDAKKLAQKIAADQAAEVKEMQDLLTKL